MARKYTLKSTRPVYDPLEDPNAGWRKDPASERQINRIKFFTGKTMTNITKGQAGMIIDQLNGDAEKLRLYDLWKSHGEPDINEWKMIAVNGQARRKEALSSVLKTILVVVFIVVAFFAFLSIAMNSMSEKEKLQHSLKPILAPVENQQVEPTGSPLPTLSPKPKPSPVMVQKTVLNRNIQIETDSGILNFKKGSIVNVILQTGDSATVKIDGIQIKVPFQSLSKKQFEQ